MIDKWDKPVPEERKKLFADLSHDLEVKWTPYAQSFKQERLRQQQLKDAKMKKDTKRDLEKRAKKYRPLWKKCLARADEELGTGWRWPEPVEVKVEDQWEGGGDVAEKDNAQVMAKDNVQVKRGFGTAEDGGNGEAEVDEEERPAKRIKVAESVTLPDTVVKVEVRTRLQTTISYSTI